MWSANNFSLHARKKSEGENRHKESLICEYCLNGSISAYQKCVYAARIRKNHSRNLMAASRHTLKSNKQWCYGARLKRSFHLSKIFTVKCEAFCDHKNRILYTILQNCGRVLLIYYIRRHSLDNYERRIFLPFR